MPLLTARHQRGTASKMVCPLVCPVFEPQALRRWPEAMGIIVASSAVAHTWHSISKMQAMPLPTNSLPSVLPNALKLRPVLP